MKYSGGTTAVLIVFIALLGCTDKQKVRQLEETTAQLKAENQLLQEEATMKNDFIEEYTKTVNEVYDNLERIRKREGVLVKLSKDVEERDKTPQRERMLNNIQSIDTYLVSSKKKLKDLKQKLDSSQLQNKTFSDMIDNLTQKVEEKEQYIEELKAQTEQLTIKFAEAKMEIQEKSELIEEKDRQINTGFYIIGSEKELKNKGIIEERGGILGIRKTKRLAPGFKKDDFLATDISATNSIAIDQGKGVKVISPHNPDSYHLLKTEEGKTVLEILDPDEFWKIKYLVILSDS